MEFTTYKFYKYKTTTTKSDRGTSLQRNFSVKSPLPRGTYEALVVLILPLFLWAHPGSVSPANISIPHWSMPDLVHTRD